MDEVDVGRSGVLDSPQFMQTVSATRTLKRRGRPVSRIEQLKKLLESDPDDVFLMFGLAMEYRKADQPEEALAEFKKINSKDPNYVPAYFMQGQTLIALGRRDEAKDVLQRGIEVAKSVNDPHAVAEMTETLQAIG